MTFFLILLFVVGLSIGLIRGLPHEPSDFHIDPLAAPSPGEGGCLVRAEGGDIEGKGYAASRETILSELDRIAMATPRTIRLAGSPGEGRITYVTRSRIMGFPDYTTVTTEEVASGTAPVILARLRIGRSDLGVNRRRVEDWLRRLDTALASA